MVELTLRSTAILATAWLLVRVLPRATAATRHLIWHAAIVAVLAAPIVSPVVPKFAVPLVAQTRVSDAVADGASRSMTAATEWITRAAATSDASNTPEAAGTPDTEDTSRTLGILGALGTLGTVLLSLWFAIGWILSALRIHRANLAPLDWHLEMNALRQKAGIRREVRLRIEPEPASPVAAGLWRATILLPPIAAQWTAERRRAVLLHELAHVRRRDCVVQLLAQAACAFYWYNPLVWIAVSGLRHERERACDDEVLRSGTMASSYATHLLDIARELRPALLPSAALAMARRSDIETRLLAVLADRQRVPRRGTRWAVASVFCVTTLVALGASTPIHARRDLPAQPGKATSLLQDRLNSAARAAAARTSAEAAATLERSSNPEERERAVMDLADASQSEALGPLEKALADPSQDVREKAALALSFMSGADVVPALLRALKDPDSQVREKAAIGLALRRDERVIEPLIAAMQDRDSQVREKVAIALGTSGDPRARVPLAQALNDPDSQVREKAVAALALLGTR